MEGGIAPNVGALKLVAGVLQDETLSNQAFITDEAALW